MTQNSNIRRIDELGRIVIPKDIRKKLHIKDNEPLEIFIESEEIRIKKYSVLPDITEYLNSLIDVGNRTTNNEYIITDREKIISSTNKSLENKKLNTNLENKVLNSKEETNIRFEEVLNNETLTGKANIVPIIIDNDRTGIIIEFNKDRDPGPLNVIKVFKMLIEKNLNNY